MTKAELITAVAEKSGLSKKDSEKAVGAVVDAITDALKAGDALVCAYTEAWNRLIDSATPAIRNIPNAQINAPKSMEPFPFFHCIFLTVHPPLSSMGLPVFQSSL